MADYVYRTVMHDIKQNILNNQYEGMRLPDERSLAEHYQVSRSSMKRALELLAQQGIVFKKRGSGTFINPLYLRNQAMFRYDGSNLGITDSFKVPGKKQQIKLLDFHVIKATKEIAEDLFLNENDFTVNDDKYTITFNTPITYDADGVTYTINSIKKTDNAPWILVFKGSAEMFYSQFRFLMLSLFLCILFLIILEFLLVARIVIPLSNNLYHAITIMTLMQDGRFDSQFEEKDLRRKDVSGTLANSINDMQHIMYTIVSELKQNISLINNSSEKISMGIDNLSNRTSSQAAAVEEITSSIENLLTAISNTSKNSYDAKNMSSKVTESTQNGVAAVNEISNNMMEISESSKEISNITKLIQSIAFQTNILALNAAVEAAHAGEQGRGFAVVASEIRSLAQNVNEAAGNITSIIENTVSKIEIGDESVKKSLDILVEIENSAKEVSDILVNIYEATSEEEESVKQINTAMNELNKITQENAELVNNSSLLGKDVVNGTNNLYSELEYFKLDKNFK